MSRYCTNCGGKLAEDARFCGGCGRPALKTAAISTPEADVPVPPPPRQTFWDEDQAGGRGIGRVVRVSRLDKIVGLILAVVIGVPLLLVVMWNVLQFLLGFFNGFFGAL